LGRQTIPSPPRIDFKEQAERRRLRQLLLKRFAGDKQLQALLAGQRAEMAKLMDEMAKLQRQQEDETDKLLRELFAGQK
jgi:hypothetical protein